MTEELAEQEFLESLLGFADPREVSAYINHLSEVVVGWPEHDMEIANFGVNEESNRIKATVFKNHVLNMASK